MMELIPKLICLEESTNIFKLLHNQEIQDPRQEVQVQVEVQVEVQALQVVHGKQLLITSRLNSQIPATIKKQLENGSKTNSKRTVLIPLN
jgi:hypothetical protein